MISDLIHCVVLDRPFGMLMTVKVRRSGVDYVTLTKAPSSSFSRSRDAGVRHGRDACDTIPALPTVPV